MLLTLDLDKLSKITLTLRWSFNEIKVHFKKKNGIWERNEKTRLEGLYQLENKSSLSEKKLIKEIEEKIKNGYQLTIH